MRRISKRSRHIRWTQTWNGDLELGVVVVKDEVITTRQREAIIVDICDIVLCVGLDAERMPGRIFSARIRIQRASQRGLRPET